MGCILYFIHELVFILYSIRTNSAITAASDVTDMQLAKHSISGHEKQISSGLWMFMLEEEKKKRLHKRDQISLVGGG